jgi:hypothetical protein
MRKGNAIPTILRPEWRRTQDRSSIVKVPNLPFGPSA